MNNFLFVTAVIIGKENLYHQAKTGGDKKVIHFQSRDMMAIHRGQDLGHYNSVRMNQQRLHVIDGSY